MRTPWKVTHIRDVFFRPTCYDFINEHRGIPIVRESDWEGLIDGASTFQEAYDLAIEKFGPPPKGLNYAFNRQQKDSPVHVRLSESTWKGA